MDSRAKELVKIGDSLFKRKRHWDELCQEICENFYPMRADFTTKFNLGDDFAVDLMDSYPVQARETLGNMPNAMLRQGEWFEVKTGDEERDEEPDNARWLEEATKRFRRLVYDRRANFVRATIEADHDYVTVGNPVLSVEESPTRDHFLFRSWHPKECAWMENSVGKVDHLQRNVMMSARNIVRKWGKAGNVHSDIRKAAESDPTKEFKVRHVVLPTDEVYGDDRKAMRRYGGTPFLSMYVDCEHEQILNEGGLPVFNYVLPRWRTLSGFQYGFSPATINALPDSRMLQSLARVILEQGEKAVDPPYAVKGEIFRDSIDMYAGGMTYVDMNEDDDLRKIIMPMGGDGNLVAGMEMKQDERNLIAESFLLNKLMLPDARELTAFETNARLDEFRRAALPFFGPIEAEYHLPLLDVAFQMAVNNKAIGLGDMPDNLQDSDVTFTFDTPLNTAEGRAAVVAFQETVQIVAGAAQLNQAIVADYDLRQATKDAVRGTGASADWFNDEDQADAEHDAEKQAMGVTKAAEFLQGGAAVAGDVANATKALKEAGLA